MRDPYSVDNKQFSGNTAGNALASDLERIEDSARRTEEAFSSRKTQQELRSGAHRIDSVLKGTEQIVKTAREMGAYMQKAALIRKSDNLVRDYMSKVQGLGNLSPSERFKKLHSVDFQKTRKDLINSIDKSFLGTAEKQKLYSAYTRTIDATESKARADAMKEVSVENALLVETYSN